MADVNRDRRPCILAPSTFWWPEYSKQALISAICYPHLPLERMADASLVVVAHRYGTHRILTFDERAFRSVAPLQGGRFSVWPADVT